MRDKELFEDWSPFEQIEAIHPENDSLSDSIDFVGVQHSIVV